jgi:adenylylsulfate kinase-like enzyme/SAM-dependent methyltransferase
LSEAQVGQNYQPGVIWITGFSGAGKTTVARKVEHILHQEGAAVVFLDGDELRNILASRWGYDRDERIDLGKVYFRLCNHLAAQGLIVVIAAVAMYQEVRAWVRSNIPRYLEVYLNVPFEVLRERDAHTKNIYADGFQVANLYDAPDGGELSLDNFGNHRPDEVARAIVDHYRRNAHTGADKGKSAHWEEYYRHTRGTLAPSSFAQFVGAQLEPSLHLLEVGCGNGRDAAYFNQLGHKVTALDPSAAAVELCRDLHGGLGIDFFVGALGPNGYRSPTSFDAIYSRFVFHAMTQLEEIQTLRSVSTLLRPGGRFYLECRSINDPLSREGEVISPTERIAGHYRRFIVLDELRDRLTNVGLEIEYEIEADNLAIYKAENPVVIRIIARKAIAGG